MDTTLSRDGEMLYAPVGTEEAVMLSVKAGSYYGLNAVARRIWELLEAPNTLPALRDVICAEFEVDVETCEADLLKFVRELMDNGLVHGAQA
ncbi:MAG: PqqD family peptide modification chaperone [Stellaceae bacterium]